jgi:phosphohistidine swiveling domain-containing protein
MTGAGFPPAEEVEGFWGWDKMHAPRPLSPLAQDLVIGSLSEGFTRAHAEFSSPTDNTFLFAQHYYYSSTRPLEDEAERERRAEAYRETLERELPEIGRRWETEWKPWLIEHATAEKAIDPATLDDDELLADLDRHFVDLTEKWTIHGRINYSLISTARFCDFYAETLEPDDDAEALAVTQGFHTRSVDASRGMWRLGRLVRADDELGALFAGGRVPGRDELADTAAGAEFLSELDDYLDEFGWRSDAVYDIADPTWREDPSIALRTVGAYALRPDDADPGRHLVAAAARREELLADARTRLADRPDDLATFERLYDAARHNMPITEDHAFWIDQTGVALVRRHCLELGRRLVDRGVLDEPDHVFMLYRAELERAFAEDGDLRPLVSERRADLAEAAGVTPPRTLGVPGPPPDDPYFEAVRVRLLGAVEPSHEATDAVVVGVGGAPGVVTGTARVVRSLDEASRLSAGDVLVCEMTLPPWVPLFAVAAGVVADTGGVLSHCAIVAREFGIPAVVGTQNGTTRIPDGATLTVDGNSGIVEIG